MTSLELDIESAFKRTLNALDLHVAALQAEIDDVYAEYGLTPSDDQWFTYVSSDRGIIQLHQDAAFVCEAIMVVGAFNTPLSTTDPNNIADTLTLSIQQMAPKHRITFSRAKGPNFADMTLMDNNGVNPEAFVPVATDNSTSPDRVNYDYFYKLPVEWLIPRGDSVQALFTDEAALGVAPGIAGQAYNAVPKVVLVGYKVF